MSSLRLRQGLGVLQLELRKNLFSARALPVYVLAALPIGAALLVMTVFSMTEIPEDLKGFIGAANFFGVLYQFILRFVVYFGAVWIFMNLFRGEMIDRSLHYYFLTPIRREVLVAAKYVSALLTVTFAFVGTTVISFVVVYGFLGGAADAGSIWTGTTFGHLAAYVLATVLGCIGYGAVFMTVGLLLRNPLVPAVAIFLWELINIFLPAALKKISVIFYLQSLFPVQMDAGPLAIIADPVSPWLGVPGLLLFTIVTLIFAGLRIRKMEVAYAAD